MRFSRQPRYEARPLTMRKEAAYARKLAKEQARYPLFPEHVAGEQRSLNDEAARRRALSAKTEQDHRDFLARVWRESRALYFAQPEDIREIIRRKWRAWTGPCTALYFSSMVDVESGEQARRLARTEREFAPIRERIRHQIQAERAAILDL
ncbi:hypothetical protein [Massilia sp.]|uniref:hypothetical protein n=1 Tax=Massilia sp. TaxID=1882437 RepID=UPI00352C2A86